MEEFFTPVSKSVLAHRELLGENVLGRKMKVHFSKGHFPDIDNCKMVLLGVKESRYSENYLGKQPVFDGIRKSFYSLFGGNWSYAMADLGDIQPGEKAEDTYYALRLVVETLVKKGKIPIVLGGSQDLLYAVYRSYDNSGRMVNFVNIDSRFDIGNSELPISSHSYVSKMVVEKPFNLHHYTNLGYQTYFNSVEEIDLLERLYFDAYRLGEVTNDLSLVEPVLRDADMACIDMASIKSSEIEYHFQNSPNGFDGREICTLARYAGISNRLSFFGIFECGNQENENVTTMLIAQIIWYFTEGVNYRMDDGDFNSNKDFTTYKVPIDKEVLVFKKSNKTQRWWIEIPFIFDANNKIKSYALLPCTAKDYDLATRQEIPIRWFKARQKNES